MARRGECIGRTYLVDDVKVVQKHSVNQRSNEHGRCDVVGLMFSSVPSTARRRKKSRLGRDASGFATSSGPSMPATMFCS